MSAEDIRKQLSPSEKADAVRLTKAVEAFIERAQADKPKRKVSIASISRSCGWSSNMLGHLMRGDRALNLNQILMLSQKLGVNAAELSPTKASRIPGLNDANLPRFSSLTVRPVEVIGVARSAVDGWFDASDWGESEKPGAETVPYAGSDESAIALRVDATQEAPRIRRGEVVVLEVKPPGSGDDVLVFTNYNRARFGRLLVIDHDTVELVPLSGKGELCILDKEDITGIRVIAAIYCPAFLSN